MPRRWRWPAHAPDVAVLDLQTPDRDGISVTGSRPPCCPGCAVVIVTGHGRAGHLERALEAGVRGFLPRTVSAPVLTDVVRTVHRGGALRGPGTGRGGDQRGGQPLTPREADVLELAAGGAPVDEIAARAHLSPGTVRNRLSAAAAKPGAPNRHAAVEAARRHGWI